jgi:hypothetical protein
MKILVENLIIILKKKKRRKEKEERKKKKKEEKKTTLYPKLLKFAMSSSPQVFNFGINVPSLIGFNVPLPPQKKKKKKKGLLRTIK